MRLVHLAVGVLQQVGAVAVQHAGAAVREAGRVLAGVDAAPGRLDADHPHLGVVEERVEQPHRVRPAADGGDQRVRQAALGLLICAWPRSPITLWKSRTIAG